MLTIINKQAELKGSEGEICAGGTDLYARRRLGISSGKITDISRLKRLDKIQSNPDESTSIGALTKIDAVANSNILSENYPALAKAAGGLATPQIRWMATIGGNLLQRNRCWYYRNPAFSCFKNGGDTCPARAGNHHYGVAFDLGPCAAVHPSTLGMALLAYDAEIEIKGKGRRNIKDLYGDGSDPSRDHQLKDQEVLTKIHLPPAVAGEKGAYFRSISRHEAEWALIEVVVRLVVEKNKITFARVAMGAVANIPMNLLEVNDFLVGQAPTKATFKKAATIAQKGANPLPMTTYKVSLIYGTVLETLLKVVEQ